VNLVSVALIMIGAARSCGINQRHRVVRSGFMHRKLEALALNSFPDGAAIFFRHALCPAGQYFAEALVLANEMRQLDCGVDVAPVKLEPSGIFFSYDTQFIQIKGIANTGATAYGVIAIGVSQFVEIYRS